jgi:hypothetical protein
MILRRIYLFLSMDDYPSEIAIPFGFETRYICNYIERKIKPLKFETKNFSRVCIQGAPSKETKHVIPKNGAAGQIIFFDQPKYLSSPPQERHEFRLSMLLCGLREFSTYYEIPINEIEEAADDFRENNYTNTWTHSDKTFPGTGVSAKLTCSLSPNDFSLRLEADLDKNTFINETILTTKPDEIIFSDKFKTLSLEDQKIVVRDKFNKILYSSQRIFRIKNGHST